MKREGEILICRRACAPLIQFYCAKLTFKEQFKFAFLYRFWCRVWINGFRFRDWIKSTQWEVGFHFLSSINPSFMKILQDQRSLVLCQNSLSTEIPIVDQCFHPRPRAGCLRVPPAHPPRLRHQRAPSPKAQSARSQGVCIVHHTISSRYKDWHQIMIRWQRLSLTVISCQVRCVLEVSDEDARHEGVEIERSSPFHLSRILAKEFGYR